jgi:hypothetical protein
MKKMVLIPLLLLAVSQSHADDKEASTCESGKEFVTTYEFLRDDADLASAGDNAVQVASKVAAGCTGAAKRFIQTAKFLKKTEIPISEILKTGIDFAQREDDHAEAFTQVFKAAYAEDGFDLDIGNSLKLAKQMSVEYSGPVRKALSSFQKMSGLCLGKGELTMSKQDCAELAKTVALASTEKGPDADDAFIKSYRFAKNNLALTEANALKLARNLIHISPSAFENFKISYEYALSPSGLNVAKDQAMKLGQNMAALTINKNKEAK